MSGLAVVGPAYRADDPDLAFLFPPVEHERRARIGDQCNSFRALEIREEGEAALVESS